MEVFGQIDKTKDGKVKSTYPAWYHKRQIEELEESIRHKEFQLDNDLVPQSEKMITRSRLKTDKDKLEGIQSATPKLSGPELDELAAIRKSLGKKISESMFSRSDMEKGIADAHEEARRMMEPCIKLDEKELKFIKSCDVSIANDGKCSRNGAEKSWKICSRLLGENSNTELLRPDGKRG